MNILLLKPGQIGIAHDGERFKVLGWKDMTMPTIGNAKNMICKRMSDGKRQYFFRGIDVRLEMRP